MAKKITERNTKNDILEAYQEVLQQLQEAKKPDRKAEREAEENQQKVEEASEMTEEKIVKEIAGLKLHLNSALDETEEVLSRERKKLTRLQEAIASESQYLEDLYDIKANADSLAALIEAQKQQKEAFDEEMKKKRETLEAEMTEKRQQWTKEQKEREAAYKEQDELLKKQRKREEEEYQYDLQLSRKKDKDDYEARKAAQEKELNERQAAVEKELTEREEKVAASEKELAELRREVASFPAELEKAVETTEKSISGKLHAQHEHELQLVKKDMEGEIRLLKQTITSLENKIKEQEALVRQLTQRSDNANTQVKEIAMKALEGASFQRFMANQPQEKKEQKHD